MANQTGAFLDSTLDRFAEVGAFIGIAVMYMASATRRLVGEPDRLTPLIRLPDALAVRDYARYATNGPAVQWEILS